MLYFPPFMFDMSQLNNCSVHSNESSQALQVNNDSEITISIYADQDFDCMQRQETC